MSGDSNGAFLDRILQFMVRVDGAVTRIERDMTGVRQDVTGLNQAMASLPQEVASLRHEVESLRQELTSLQQEVASLKHTTSRLDEGLTRLRVDAMARLDRLGDEISFIRADIVTNYGAATRATEVNDNTRSELRSLGKVVSSMQHQMLLLQNQVQSLRGPPA